MEPEAATANPLANHLEKPQNDAASAVRADNCSLAGISSCHPITSPQANRTAAPAVDGEAKSCFEGVSGWKAEGRQVRGGKGVE